MLKGFSHARLACGCRLAFREGSSGSPLPVVLDTQTACWMGPRHAPSLTLDYHREALRPSTRLGPPGEEEFEEEN